MVSRRTIDDWRRAVYRARVSGNVQVLLLLMSDHMRANLTVSVPRVTLAKELGIHEQRVAERIKVATDDGWLFLSAGGYRGRTAEYRALFPGERVRKVGTHSEGERVRPTSTHSTPEIGTHSTNEWVPDGGYAITTADLSPVGADRNVSSNEGIEDPELRNRRAVPAELACEFHPWQPCPSDCRSHRTSSREETA